MVGTPTSSTARDRSAQQDWRDVGQDPVDRACAQECSRQRGPALQQHVGAVRQRLDHLVRVPGADHHGARVVVENVGFRGDFALAHDHAQRLALGQAIRRAAAPSASGRRRSTVPVPTTIASAAARRRCTSARAASLVIHWLLPSAAALRPSMLVANFHVTCGSPVRCLCSHSRSGPPATSSASTPSTTCTPASGQPARSPGGRRVRVGRRRTTTAEIPAATSASTHGGVVPWWLHGSSVTTAVPPAARSPARRSATTSACGPPGGSVPPTPTTSRRGPGSPRRPADSGTCHP